MLAGESNEPSIAQRTWRRASCDAGARRAEPGLRRGAAARPADPRSRSRWFEVGSQDDPPGKEGLAFLTGEMLGEAATEKRSLDEILAALYPLAASYACASTRR